MSILAALPDALTVEASWPQIVESAVTVAIAAEVGVVDNGDPLGEIPAVLGGTSVYEGFPLPKRGAMRLRADVIRRLQLARDLLPAPFSIVVLDGWRSVDYQRRLLGYYRSLDGNLQDGFVADPDSGWIPPHTTGGAVDLTLSWKGTPLALGTDFDAFTDVAHIYALEAAEPKDARTRDLRRMLSAMLVGAGFASYSQEWWHWSYGDQWWAATTGADRAIYGQVAD